MASVEVGPAPEKGFGRIRRAYVSPDRILASPEDGINTLYDILQSTIRQKPDKNALGWRDIVKMHEEKKEITKTVGGKEVKETKTWKYFELSDYKYITYKEMGDKVDRIGSGLTKLGLNKETIFNIYASTSPNWQLAANGCIRQSIRFATAYDSLGEDGLIHSLNEPEVVGIFTNSALLPTVSKAIPSTKTVKFVIYDGQPEGKEKEALESLQKTDRDGFKILHLDELIKLGEEGEVEKAVPPTRDDIACIMYTSGSTGAPKGVLLTHGNVIASVAGVNSLIGHLLTPQDFYMAYLPLAHILEFVVEMTALYLGVVMGYGKVQTLTDNSVRNCVGDIRAFKPTVMTGVPAVWELIRKGIQGKVNAGGSIKKNLFAGALSAKKSFPSLAGPITDAVVFKAVRQATGGRLRFALSGGAPLSRETQEFLSMALVRMLQGYGLTESCGMCAILTPDFAGYGTVGVPVPSVQVRLVDVPDAGYFVTNTPSQGEIWIQGESITKGYFKREDETKEAFTEDGWFKTGDVGQWNKDGTLSIIDRKKNLVKLSGGEYIALERLESVYKSSELVSNICVVAHSDAKQPAAIIFPHAVNLTSKASSKGLVSSNEDLESLCKNKEVAKLVNDELKNVAKSNGFKQLEFLQTVILTDTEWTPQNGFTTAAQKLQRKKIQEHYKEEVDKVYP